MVFFTDESIEAEITTFLRKHEYIFHSISELTPSISDESVLEFAVRHEAVLLTNDKDFGDLVIHQGLSHRGIILLRFRKTTIPEKARIVHDVIRKHESELPLSFTVITPTSVRIRKI